ncbi:MAG: hypothetical protein ABEJ22_04040 [Haloferacaceae archaeon]
MSLEMNLDELRSVQRTERQKDSLQHLRDSFYADVAGYIEQLKDERSRAASEAADPFSDPDVQRLTDEIETAEDIVESVYERRVGKVVKLASFAAADMSADTDGLTEEELRLFDDLVDRIQQNRRTVLDTLAGRRVGGEATPGDGGAEPAGDPARDGDRVADPGAAASDDAEPTTPGTTAGTDSGPESDRSPPPDAVADGPPDAVGSADDPSDAVGSADDAGDVLASAMGGDGDADDGHDPEAGESAAASADDAAAPTPPPDLPPGGEDDADGSPATDSAGVGGATEAGGATETNEETGPAGGTGGVDDTRRTTVRVLDDVGEILGVDERTYELDRESVVALPEENADLLVQRDAAERID